jgi:hypothetical protein
MKSLKKLKKPKAFTKKQLEAEITRQAHFVLQAVITRQLMELYSARPEDFKKVFGAYIDKWVVVSPYTKIEHFAELCDTIASSLTHYYIRAGEYPMLLSNHEHKFIGLTKNQKYASSPEDLLDFLEKVCDVGPNHDQLIQAEKLRSDL